MEETIRQKREANGAGQKKLEAALELKRSEVQQAAIESQMRRNELEELSKRLEWKDSRTLRGELEKRSRELETLAEAVTAADTVSYTHLVFQRATDRARFSFLQLCRQKSRLHRQKAAGRILIQLI